MAVKTPPEVESFRIASSRFQAAKAAGRWAAGPRSCKMGQMRVQCPQRTHFSMSIWGKSKPVRSRTMAMASLGQPAAQVVHPVQRLRSASFGAAVCRSGWVSGAA